MRLVMGVGVSGRAGLSSCAGLGIWGWSGVFLGLEWGEKGLILWGLGIIFKKSEKSV